MPMFSSDCGLCCVGIGKPKHSRTVAVPEGFRIPDLGAVRSNRAGDANESDLENPLFHNT
jgi:hypothetical protein